ncbi:SPFH domain-containing protein [Aliikangiella maris]|uniref:SPFH domain-containing protein n=2 Tax=Aliikangiella maris TaxID=3162458 RepID=A0ABV2BZ09_9GAMM
MSELVAKGSSRNRILSVLSIMLGGIIFTFVIAYNSIFYAEPGYIYHVRTLLGSEEVVTEVGYKFYPFGRYNSWKRAMTVQAAEGSKGNAIRAEQDSDNTSASLPPMSIMFLDQVDAHAQATVRFSIPSDPESFLKLAHEYRSPENLLRTALMPAFKETLQANASLMSAEEYYSGGRTQFNSEFEDQMRNGIFLVKREEIEVKSPRTAKSTANAALGTSQQQYGDDSKTVFVVKKVLDDDGQPRRKTQRFLSFGISVVSALVTDMRPNQKFVERMQLKQKASADRAIAREQRVQEEEQRLLAIARGEREVAERQAKAKVEQIQKTTEAETEKQLAITSAEKLKAQATISRETAQINFEKAKIEAETKKTLAEAEAYQKRVILEADNALAQKLEAEIRIQTLWAEAFAKRKVPTTVFGGGAGGSPVGSDGEVKAFMQMLTMDAAQRLNYNRDLNTQSKK